jgi:beta-mannosidase
VHGCQSLNGTWSLTYAEGLPLVDPTFYTGVESRGRRYLPARVPAPIHQILTENGLVDDPNIGMNSLKARWVEEQFWIYRHQFTVSAEAVASPAWLVFDRLEYEAEFWVNGEPVGRHANAHRPARVNVTGKLKAGENLLVVRLSAGMHSAADKPAGEYWSHSIEMLTRRVFHRKPAYQCGWDWNPRLVNVGILGDVRLEWAEPVRLDDVTVFAVLDADLAAATLFVRATVEGTRSAPLPATFRAKLGPTGQQVSLDAIIQPGENRLELKLRIDKPRLWWPIGQGEQFLYTVEVALDSAGEQYHVVRRTGVRRVEMDQSAHPQVGRYCMLRVNNRPIFCKGGNWVPADLMYSTVTAARYRELVDLAVAANFNMLRVWGGGLFADHALCEACDERGVLIWHDFLFACAKYPGDDPEFTREARLEVTRAVRDLACHPSLVVWCGNNEIEWGDWGWGYDTKTRTHPHYALFHHDIPKIVLEENPSAAYWFSSPWSPDYQAPNDPTMGDQHPWSVSILTPGATDFWSYRTFVDRFPNEGGVLGASSPATLRQFLPENERCILSPSWDHHDNPLACSDAQPGDVGRAYSTVQMWLGRDPLAMDWEQYAFCSALLQAEGLYEYISNYRRRMFSSASAIFWMYNDSWPVTHGWTIVDYYLRKKLAYHPVRRAFAPVTVVVAAEDEEVVVYGVNETPDRWSGEVRYGLFLLAGGMPVDCNEKITLEPNTSTPVARFSRGEWKRVDPTKSGAFAILQQGGRVVAQHRVFVERFKDLRFVEPAISLSRKGGVLTLKSDQFAWGVCLDVDGELPLADNCFDLIPGVPYFMPWSSGLPAPTIARVGSVHALKLTEEPGK